MHRTYKIRSGEGPGISAVKLTAGLGHAEKMSEYCRRNIDGYDLPKEAPKSTNSGAPALDG
jgi:hypothetical protein